MFGADTRAMGRLSVRFHWVGHNPRLGTRRLGKFAEMGMDFFGELDEYYLIINSAT